VRVFTPSSLCLSRSASIENPIMVAIKREHARDSAIVASLALQHGTDIETIRKALCRDSNGRATGTLGVALDLLADDGALL
jgi:hypothetical protein